MDIGSDVNGLMLNYVCLRRNGSFSSDCIIFGDDSLRPPFVITEVEVIRLCEARTIRHSAFPVKTLEVECSRKQTAVLQSVHLRFDELLAGSVHEGRFC